MSSGPPGAAVAGTLGGAHLLAHAASQEQKFRPPPHHQHLQKHPSPDNARQAQRLSSQEALDADSGDEANGNSPEDRSDNEGDSVDVFARPGKRKRPISVSCELCKQRKVKCDRGQPSCGWCSRNGAVCEYKERKKPGLRAGYGRELESRLDKLEAILRRHSEVLQMPFDPAAQAGTLPPHVSFHNPSISAPPPGSVRGSNGSMISEERGTPQDLPTTASLFSRVDTVHTPQAEAALFLQKPSTGSFSASTPAPGIGGSGAPGSGGGSTMELGITSPASAINNANNSTTFGTATGPIPGISPSHQSQPSPLSTPAAREYYGASAPPPPTGAGISSPMNTGPSKTYLGSDQDLPPYDLSYALVDLYFKHINTWCPLLQRNPTIEALFGPSMTEETNKILLHAIVATTIRFSTDARLTDEKRQRYHDISKQRVLLYGMENSSVKALQALVVLALDLCGSSNGPPGWNIMALITRAVVQLGLAVETNSFSVSPSYTSIYTLRAMILPEPRDFIEEESRRRLFWVIYLLDRYATIATAFEFALDDREIDRTLPCRDDLWIKNQKVETRWFRTDFTDGNNIGGGTSSIGTIGGAAANSGFEAETGGPSDSTGKPENLGSFSYYIEILGILTKIHNFLKLPVDISSLSDVEQWQMRYRELDQMLTSWKLGIPSEYGNMSKLFQPNCAKTVNCGWIMLHITYHTAIIRLHSSSAYPTTRSPIFTPSFSASQRCHSAVENIATLTEFVVANGFLPKLGPPFAFSLWVAARLLLVHGSTVEHKLSPRVPYFVDTLRAMGRNWPVAARYCELLQRVLDEHSDSERHGDGVTPSSVKILADMRRTAFDLDLLISRQPRHVSGAMAGVSFSSGASAFVHDQGHHNGNNHAGMALQSGIGGSGGGNGGGHSMSRFPSVTPARTPQPNELEYLDVFDFFNMPRLPFGLPTETNGSNGNGHNSNGNGSGDAESNSNNNSNDSKNNNNTNNTSSNSNNSNNNNNRPAEPGGASSAASGTSFGNEFNITDFMIDANRDWLFKH